MKVKSEKNLEVKIINNLNMSISLTIIAAVAFAMTLFLKYD